MKFYKNLIFIIFISVFTSNIFAAESDNVSTDSAEFNTSNYEDYINDFIKHPKSKNNYIWEEFTNFLLSYNK